MINRRQGLGYLAMGLATAGPIGAATDAMATEDTPPPNDPKLTFVFEAIVNITKAEDLGPFPLGRRRIVPIIGGMFEGPGLKGIVRPGGADRQIIRVDGLRQLHALYELETDDGAVITVSNRVLIDDTRPGSLYAFSNVELAAPDGRYGWLNRKVFVGSLNPTKPGQQAVKVRVFALS